MSNTPIIGVPCRHDTSGYYGNRPVNSQNNAYITAIINAGGAPFLIPVQVDEEKLQKLYTMADGILLTGGGDVDPAWYNQPPHPATAGIQTDRDQVEITLARWASAGSKPLLGICRGLQVMTVAAGGTLCQDINSEMPDASRHDYLYRKGGYARNYLAHHVTVKPESRLAQIIQAETIAVNSLHHQAIQSAPKPYQIIAYAQDGVPEAIDLPGHPFCCGVQWHPEELVDDEEAARKIFSAFVAACRAAAK